MHSIRRLCWIGLSGLLLAGLAYGLTLYLFPAATATPTPTAQIRHSNNILPAMTRVPTATRRPPAITTIPRPPTTVQHLPAAEQKPGTSTTPPATVPRAAATPDSHLIVITEEDITRAIATGVGTEQGLSAQGLRVRFHGEQMTLAAEELSLGPVQVRQLVMIGQLVAENGELHFEADSVSPRGLVTSLLPSLADQALSRYAARWYVEDVRLLDGRLELHIR